MAVGVVWYGAKYSQGVWERFPDIIEKTQIWKISDSGCPRVISFRSFWKRDFLVCLDRSATTKMTAWIVGSFHGFDLRTHLLGETLPKNPQGGLLTF